MSSTYGTLPSTDNDDDTLVSTGKCTVVQTVVNTVMIITGAGMLSLPYAAANVGWSCVVVLVVVAGAFMYAFDLVAEALEQLIARHATTHDRRQYVASLTYISLAEAAFGPRGAGLVTLSLSVELFLALTSFFINIGLNLQTVFAAVDVATGIGLAATLTCVLASLDLQYASYTSALGVCLTGLLLVALLVAGAQLPISSSAATAYVFFVPQRLPVSLGLVAFCFGGVGAFPQIYTSMQVGNCVYAAQGATSHPTHPFPQHRSACRVALVAAGTIVLALYASVMVAGYAIYGQYAAEVVTRNLGRSLLGEDLPRGHIVRVIAAVGVLFNIQVSDDRWQGACNTRTGAGSRLTAPARPPFVWGPLLGDVSVGVPAGP
jgi:amino acid permease